MSIDIQLRTLNALGDELRLRIVMLLLSGELCVDDLVRILGVAQPRISRQLGILRNLGLLKDRKQWNQVFYAVDMRQERIRTVLVPFLHDFLKDSRLIEQDSQRRLAQLRDKSATAIPGPDRQTPVRVLFVCEYNAMRSQMAEAWLNKLGQPGYVAQSAGLYPSTLDPLVVKELRLAGLDVSSQRSKSLADLSGSTQNFDHVITVCEESRDPARRLFQGRLAPLHWDIPDPSKLQGTLDEREAGIRAISEQVRELVLRFIGRNAG